MIKKIKYKSINFIFLVFWLILFSKSAYAYLDMGTLTFVFQFILAGIVGGLIWLKLYWIKVKNFFSKIFNSTHNNDKHS